MLAGIPLLTFILLVLLCRYVDIEWRRAFLSATVFWGLLVTAMTEVLSLFHVLSSSAIGAAWVLATLVTTLAGWWRLRKAPPFSRLSVTLSYASALLIGGVAVIVSVSGFLALISPPNTWDAMTYHMSRVMHWIQNHSLENYPTHTWRELHRSPWAEFVILHFQLLSQSDRFANLVQWFSMGGSLVAVTVIARQLGADTRGEALAALVGATLPIGILEASSTQTDYVATFWLLCCVAYVLILVANPRTDSPWATAFKLGASLGLALLTKPSNYLFALPFLIWLIIALRTATWTRASAILVLIVTLSLAINLGHYQRNWTLYGSPLGPETEEAYCNNCKLTNEAWTIPLIVSNIIRNVAVHLGTPVESFNLLVENMIERAHALMAISTADPRNTYLDLLFKVQRPLYSEDYDGNTLHLLLITGSLAVLLLSRRPRPPGLVNAYAIAIIIGFLLLCLVVKWNPFISRVQLPLFVLWTPVIALLLSKCKPGWVVHGIGVVLLMCALPWLLFNARHPLVTVETPAPKHLARLYPSSTNISILDAPRESQYFYAHHELEPRFREAAHLIKRHGCYRIGLIKGWDDWEYPLWPLLQAETNQQIRIEHIEVMNQSGELAKREQFARFTPCAYVGINRDDVKVMIVDDRELN